MSDEVIDLRKGDRFHVVQPISGACGGADVTLINVSISGAQLMHAAPLRIGTRATLTFTHRDVSASVVVHIVWSHLAPTEHGLRYRSGVHLDEPNVQYAAGLNALLRAGLIALDTESLERKKQREKDREERKKSGPKPAIQAPS